MQFNSFTTFATATVITACTMPAIIYRLKQSNQLDVPNDRSMHTIPIPRGGGIGIAAVASILGLVSQSDRFSLVTICAAGSLAAVGYRDDSAGTAPKTRLLLQFLVGAVAAGFLVVNMTGGIIWIMVFYVGATCWIAAYVNAFNFMDGINGISALHCITGGLAYAWMGFEWSSSALQSLGTILAASALGFLPFNFPVARVYLGDVGSYFCGGWLGVLPIIAIESDIPFIVAVSPLLLYLADTAITLIKKLRSGQSLTTPHKSHAYQRLAMTSNSHGFAASLAAAVSALTSLAVIQSRDSSLTTKALCGLGVSATIAFYLSLPGCLQKFAARTGRFEV